MNKAPTIVIDCGAYLTRVGISGNDVPEETFPTVVGREKEGGCGHVLVGEDATEIRGKLDMCSPVDKYTITDMAAVSHIWEYCCKDVLGCDSLEECPVLVTDGPVEAAAMAKSRAKITELMFEKSKVPYLYIAMQPFLSLISINKTTGLVADVGHSMASVVPVVDGAVVHEGVLTMDTVAGRQITDYLMEMLNEREGVSITDRETVTSIKEKLGYVSCDYEGEFKWAASETKDYTLPDGKVIAVGTERFRCTEPLFRPSLLGPESHGGVHKMVYQAISRCPESVRPDLLNAIMLAGGSTHFPNLADRLTREVRHLAGDETEVRVLAPPTRSWSAWLGGSLLGEWEGFLEVAVSKQEYQESGAEIVNKKCKN